MQILGSQLEAIKTTSINLEGKKYVKMTFHGYVINERNFIRFKRVLNAKCI